jgi:hypothetical protein
MLAWLNRNLLLLMGLTWAGFGFHLGLMTSAPTPGAWLLAGLGVTVITLHYMTFRHSRG